ncbi:efflux RND transporter permease subunit [Azospirillum sp. RWY-5-1]|uniref:Efflux RND transporter permease subunit n=1 Tax=Azospirillum oleiclasticum TaxID=2735135 RepID=A0ABX2T8Y9_9PROT|nr:efflux RND transporter permease subunit [Azospirillum oleiclasticum]NYZ12513.1 efflux RND transporter permease subunit [Azospirillum oleiclasticum]NYZ19673.1 efflux RND transporter permease subunit [Azospirillum oleiclasticum]
MRISEICVQRPVFATVMSLVLVLVGAVSYQRLTVREYPNIDEPVVSVVSSYPGASAEIIETQVTQVLEGSIAGIEGIDTLTSVSRAETSRITVTFRSTVDPDVAASDVRDRVGRVRGRLPDELEEPVIAKVEADAQPVMFMPFTSDRLSSLEITDYLDRVVIDRFKNLPGVADVTILGERRYAMRIWLDRDRLAAYALTVQDVEEALRAQNIEIPSGRIESRDREFTVLSRTGLVTPEQFGAVVVKRADGFPVRLRDVAGIELGAADDRRASRSDGRNAISIGIVKQATANPLDVSKGVRGALPQVIESLPEGMTAAITYDSSVFIDRSINAVFHTIVEAIVLVVLVILFFLRSFRASLIPIVTIPVSLITSFALMYALGFSVNTLTLLAMVLAIGLVVDDAIVVLENVHRHVEEGKRPNHAAIVGTREIGLAVVAMTLTLAAVYAPVAFAPGRTGRLFLEFALTLAGSVLVSGFVALTLTPMMCAKLIRPHESHGRVYNALERLFEGMAAGYRRALGLTLRVRWLVVLLAVGVAGASGVLFTIIKSELAPIEDRGVIRAFGTGPEGATIDYTSRYTGELEKIVSSVPEVESYIAVAGWPEVTRSVAFARLKDWDERERSQQEIAAEMQARMSRIAGMTIVPVNPPSFGQRGSSRPVEYVIQTSGTYAQLQQHVDRVMERIRDYPGLVGVDSDLKLNKPQVEVTMNRDKVTDAGVQVSTVGRTLETMLGGRQVTRFEQNGEQYDVILRLGGADRNTPRDLSRIYVRGADGTMIQLSNLVTAEEKVAPKELNRFNQLRSATITATLAPGTSLGEALAFLDRTTAEVLPQGVLTDYAGQSREFREAGSSLLFVFVLALAFIYLVLAAQFESFVDPLIIMVTVPLSMTGALLALHLAGGTLNVYSQIGLITLVGLITKHGILIVEFANQLQEQGQTTTQAAIESAVLRLRPILMTTGAMVLGAVPLALATGAGAESRQQIGWVIVGGMTFGTLLTLFVVPAAYTLIARRRTAEAMEPLPQPAE